MRRRASTARSSCGGVTRFASPSSAANRRQIRVIENNSDSKTLARAWTSLSAPGSPAYAASCNPIHRICPPSATSSFTPRRKCCVVSLSFTVMVRPRAAGLFSFQGGKTVTGLWLILHNRPHWPQWHPIFANCFAPGRVAYYEMETPPAGDALVWPTRYCCGDMAAGWPFTPTCVEGYGGMVRQNGQRLEIGPGAGHRNPWPGPYHRKVGARGALLTRIGTRRFIEEIGVGVLFSKPSPPNDVS